MRRRRGGPRPVRDRWVLLPKWLLDGDKYTVWYWIFWNRGDIHHSQLRGLVHVRCRGVLRSR